MDFLVTGFKMLWGCVMEEINLWTNIVANPQVCVSPGCLSQWQCLPPSSCGNPWCVNFLHLATGSGFSLLKWARKVINLCCRHNTFTVQCQKLTSKADTSEEFIFIIKHLIYVCLSLSTEACGRQQWLRAELDLARKQLKRCIDLHNVPSKLLCRLLWL